MVLRLTKAAGVAETNVQGAVVGGGGGGTTVGGTQANQGGRRRGGQQNVQGAVVGGGGVAAPRSAVRRLTRAAGVVDNRMSKAPL